MRWKSKNERGKELSRRLGDRGDLVACLTSEIGREVEQASAVSQDNIDELINAMDEIRGLLEEIEDGSVAGEDCPERVRTNFSTGYVSE
jgi:hypothetical protein